MKKLIVLALLISCVTFFWYTRALKPVDPESEQRQVVTIESGLSLTEIAEFLKEKGLIRSPLAFSFYARRQGKQSSLQAGVFVLHTSMTTAEIIETLETGKAEEVRITVPEGFTVSDLDVLLAEKGLIQAGEVKECLRTCDFSSFEFLSSDGRLAKRGGKLEGYLFPETYFVDPEDFVVKFFLERLMTTFRHRVLEEYQEDITASGRSFGEIITMASLVEEETITDAERPVVAGILWKRYDEEIGLGVDATVRYILEKTAQPLTTKDLDTDSPYNTRKFRGLPPGPIASPGLASISATIQPEESPYWYYLHGQDGRIHYASTNDEHNENKRKYLR
jgi:UPF0755 protein